MKILVSPIAFNEEVKLRRVVDRFLKSPLYGKVDYCVVDDGSNDGTQKMLQGYAGRGVRTLRKRDMVHNFLTPKVTVDPETYQVHADGVLLDCEPATELPMAQRYFLF